MQKKLEAIYNFHCPRWDELPGERIFNQEVVDYICKVLEPISFDEVPITTTMVQNYVKLEYMPKSPGRKYNRTQIAYLIVISIYKRVLNIKDVRKGVDLQLNLMDIKAAYNIFAQGLEDGIRRNFKSTIESNEFKLCEFVGVPESAGIDIIAHAFALRLLGTILIESNGYKGLGGKNE